MHLPRRPSKKKMRRHPRSEAPSAPWLTNNGKSYLDRGSLEMPEWREGPTGRGTLQLGWRVVQVGEAASRVSAHGEPQVCSIKVVNYHHNVLELHRNRQSNDEHPSPLLGDSVVDLPPIRDDRPTNMAGLASVDRTHSPGYTDNPNNMPHHWTRCCSTGRRHRSS